MSETFEGATIEAALEAASAKMGVSAADLDHEVLEEKTDFWGTGEGTVVVKVWEREQPSAVAEVEVEAATAPETREPEATEEPVEEAAAAPADSSVQTPQDTDETDAGPAEQASSERVSAVEDTPAADETREPDAAEAGGTDSAEASGAVAAAASPEAVDSAPETTADQAPSPAEAGGEDVDPSAISGMLEQIFHDMEFECTVSVEPEEDGFLATIDGADKDALLEGNGRCLSALELLINNAFRHKLPRGNKVRVDAGDFRNRRDEELSDLAFQVAHSAKESGRTQETQPLNPYERRLVHLALAEDPAVTTRSRGSGFLKNVQVIPRGASSGRGRRG